MKGIYHSAHIKFVSIVVLVVLLLAAAVEEKVGMGWLAEG